MESRVWALVPAIGLIMGFATSNVGFTSKVEFSLWSLLYAAVAALAGFTGWSGWSDFGLFVGLSALGGSFTGVLQATLLENYRTNNPHYADQVPASQKEAFAKFVPFALFMGALFGAIFAGVAWALSAL